MTEETKQSRFAELAFELMGTKAATQFLQEAWDYASDEAKRDLADGFLQLLVDQCRRGSFEVRSMAERIIYQRVQPMVEAELKAMEPAIADQVKSRMAEEVKRSLESCARIALERALKEVHAMFQRQL